MITASLQRTFVFVVMALLLLAALLGWTARMTTYTPALQPYFGLPVHSYNIPYNIHHQGCPPPPAPC